MKQSVYKSTVADINDYNKVNFDILMPGIAGVDLIVYTPVSLPRASFLVKKVIEWYESDDFHKRLEKNQEAYKYYEQLGLKFEDVYSEEDGKKHKRLILGKKAYQYLCSWRLEVNTSDDEKLVALTMGGSDFPMEFCNTDILDKYCPEAIEKLKKENFIEKTEMDDER